MAPTTTATTPWFHGAISWTTVAAIVTALVTILAVFVAVPQPKWNWDVDVLPLARQYNPTTTTKNNQDPSNTPLKGVVVVITGATSGIGHGLTKVLSRLGAHVVAVGRSPSKLEQLTKDLQEQQQSQQQQDKKVEVTTIVADLEDLASVAKAADQIRAAFPRIDILINNAGLHLGGRVFDRRITKQGYDLAFGVNYLSHFLLTEKLMPSLLKSTKPRIVQISSTFHVAVDGSDLAVRPPLSSRPVASQPGGSRGFYIFRTQRQYANSKLAQILHARALQRRYVIPTKQQQQQPKKKNNNNIGTNNNGTWIRSACPGWVSTNIAGGGLLHQILSTFAYPVQGWGLASILRAIFDDEEDQNSNTGGGSSSDKKDNPATTVTTPVMNDYFANTSWTVWVSPLMSRFNWLLKRSFCYKVGLRDAVFGTFANVILFTQKFLPYAGPSLSSPESYNTTLQDQLYQWSREAVAPWL